LATHSISHRERLEKCLRGEKPDRTPVALWRHFPVDDQTPEGLAGAVLNFQQAYDFDLVKVTPASSFCLKDWGVEDAWRGATEGTRDYTRRRIYHPDDWGQLNVLDPYRGYLADQLSCLDMINSEIGQHTPVLQTIFNPLSQAKNLAGGNLLISHLRKAPDAVHEGLKIIAESTLEFIKAAKKTGMAGIFYAVQHASYALLTEDEYQAFGEAYDLLILEEVKNLWCNMLHLHGTDVMFDLVSTYPVQIINWHDRDTKPSLADAATQFGGILCGGLQREDTMVLGTPSRVTAEATDAIMETRGMRFILGTGCVLPTIAPRGNILAARQSVELAS
jgi:uroporphyrinogen decarboxylase